MPSRFGVPAHAARLYSFAHDSGGLRRCLRQRAVHGFIYRIHHKACKSFTYCHAVGRLSFGSRGIGSAVRNYFGSI